MIKVVIVLAFGVERSATSASAEGISLVPWK
jgi:hypothetical protein